MGFLEWWRGGECVSNCRFVISNVLYLLRFKNKSKLQLSHWLKWRPLIKNLINKSSNPTLGDLFIGFSKIGILGFGGVVAVARHIIVEERQWLNDEEYASVLAIGQVLPGANTINAGVMIGDRFQGKLGSLVCVLGIMALPAIIVVILAFAYNQFASIPRVQIALIGASAAAAGAILGSGLKMLCKIKAQISDYLIVAITIACIAIFHFPLATTLVVLIPLSLVIAWGMKK